MFVIFAVVRIWEEDGSQKAELQYQWGNQLRSRGVEGLCWGTQDQEVFRCYFASILTFLTANSIPGCGRAKGWFGRVLEPEHRRNCTAASMP